MWLQLLYQRDLHYLVSNLLQHQGCYESVGSIKSLTWSCNTASWGVSLIVLLFILLNHWCCQMLIWDPSPIHHLKPSLISPRELQMLRQIKLGLWPRLESKKFPVEKYLTLKNHLWLLCLCWNLTSLFYSKIPWKLISNINVN